MKTAAAHAHHDALPDDARQLRHRAKTLTPNPCGAPRMADHRRARQLDAADDLGEAMRLTKKSAADVAAALGDVTPSTVEKLRGGGSALSVRDVLAIGDRGLGDTARASLRLSLARLEPEAPTLDVAFLAKLLGELADVGHALAKALADGVVSDDECSEVLREVMQAVECLGGLIAVLRARGGGR